MQRRLQVKKKDPLKKKKNSSYVHEVRRDMVTGTFQPPATSKVPLHPTPHLSKYPPQPHTSASALPSTPHHSRYPPPPSTPHLSLNQFKWKVLTKLGPAFVSYCCLMEPAGGEGRTWGAGEWLEGEKGGGVRLGGGGMDGGGGGGSNLRVWGWG